MTARKSARREWEQRRVRTYGCFDDDWVGAGPERKRREGGDGAAQKRGDREELGRSWNKEEQSVEAGRQGTGSEHVP